MSTATSRKKRAQRRRRRANFAVDASGWETCTTPFASVNGNNPLSVHSDWYGPRKLVGADQVSEVFVDRDAEEWVTDGAVTERGSLIRFLINGALRGEPDLRIRDWVPPTPDDLMAELRTAGHNPAVDDDGTIRLTLKSRGCDGQVVIPSASGRLRLTMGLGRWDTLNTSQEDAMLLIARQFNDRTRLVRIGWHAEDASRRCDAQVDLSGLPVEPSHHGVWQGMLQVATLGLELALRHLSKELDVIAQPRHEHLARRLAARCSVKNTTVNNKPRKAR